MPSGSINISFKNEHSIYESIIKCTVKDYEFQYSYNPTLIESGSTGVLKSFATGSDFTPYVTTIGLYNDTNDLLAVVKLSKPIPLSKTTDTTFLIKIAT